jgi:hypothetical protein
MLIHECFAQLEDVVDEHASYYDNEARTSLAVATLNAKWSFPRGTKGKGKGEDGKGKGKGKGNDPNANPGKGAGLSGGARKFTGDPKYSGFKERAFKESGDLYKVTEAFKVKFNGSCAEYWLRTCRNLQNNDSCHRSHDKPAGFAEFAKEHKLEMKF